MNSVVNFDFKILILILVYSVTKCVCTDFDSNEIKHEIKEIQKPNIIFIIADDAGWNDFSFHGSPQIPTPNIDAVALNGVILNGYYSAPLCTPSRGSTLTGKYAIRLGLQHFVITGGMTNGLPLQEKLLPEYFKEMGYRTHLVGKWHLGHARKSYTPTFRGFDSHYGYYLGMQDYYSHMTEEEEYGTGYDFRSNLSVNYDAFGKYNTDLFTDEAVRLIEENPVENPLFLMITHEAPHSSFSYDPLQAPPENVEKFDDSIDDINRRKFAGMVDKLDESVGRVMGALGRRKMIENSIIIFVSDNGGPPEGYGNNHASNWPLRGTKNTLWEGGTRLAACIWSPLLKPHVHQDQMHAIDWLPTLVEAAQGEEVDLGDIDGVSQWKSLMRIGLSPRNEFIYNIDGNANNSAVRFGKWKLVQGNTSNSDFGECPVVGPDGPSCDNWFGPSGRNSFELFDDESETCSSGCEFKSVQDLIPIIVASEAGQAFDGAGFPINQQLAKDMQDEANIELQCFDSTKPEIECNAFKSPCLFDIDDDPCEKRNLAQEQPELVDFLTTLIQKYNVTAIPPIPSWNDPNSDPAKWGYIWTYFMDLIPFSI